MALSNEATHDLPKPRVIKAWYGNQFQFPFSWNCFGNQTSRPNVVKFWWNSYHEETHNIPSEKELDIIDEMNILQLNQEDLKKPSSTDIQATWLGHASFLIQLDGVNILFDPVFSDKIGPVQGYGVGIRRYRKCPCTVNDLPDIDIVCISHDHYDHLDMQTVTQLDKRFGSKIHWCVPLGIDKWLEQTIAAKSISAFNWWDTLNVDSNQQSMDIHVTCVPAQHWGKRSLWDENTRLWSGWIIRGSNQKVYHAGDTGYCDVFKLIGKHYGPIDLALIPIGAYSPRNVLSFQHVDPKEAVQIHQDVQAQKSMAMHWGTFNLTKEHYLEPPKALKAALNNAGISEENFVAIKHGQTLSFPRVDKSNKISPE